MKKIGFELAQREIEESLICLDYRIEGRFKRWNIVILTIIGGLLLTGFLKYPDRFYLAMSTFVVIIFLICIIYVPSILRKRKAAKMAKSNGHYEIEITNNGVITGDSNKSISFSAKVMQLFDSESVITLRIQNEVICIPKRVINDNMIKELKTMIKQNGGEIYNVSTKEG